MRQSSTKSVYIANGDAGPSVIKITVQFRLRVISAASIVHRAQGCNVIVIKASCSPISVISSATIPLLLPINLNCLEIIPLTS